MRTRGRPRHPDILTPRQWEVLALLRQGLTNDEIARELNISTDGVKYHVSDILHRLGVENRHEAAAWQPEQQRSSWMLVIAPALAIKRFKPGALGYALTTVVAGGAVIGSGLLVWGLMRTHNSGNAVTTPGATALARTNVPEVDHAIDLLVHQDVDGLVGIAGYGPIGCGITQTVGSPPPCPAGQPEGAPVNVFAVGECEGSDLTNNDQLKVAFGLALQRQPSAAVYAVLRENSQDRLRDSYWIAITQDRPSQATADVSLWNVTADGHIIALQNECGPIGAAQQVAYRFPINPEFVLGPFNNCSPSTGETANFMITVDGLSPGGIKPQFWGQAQSTLGSDTGERAIVTVTGTTTWYGDLQRLEDVRTGNVLEAVGRREPDCTILAETILSPLSPKVFKNDALGVELQYPSNWSEGAPPMPYATCYTCTVVGPKDLQYPYGIEIFDEPLDPRCTPTCYNTIRALPQGSAETIRVAGQTSTRVEFERQAPLGLVNDTGETTPYREIWTLLPWRNRAILIVAFFRYGDADGEARVRTAYASMLATAAALPP